MANKASCQAAVKERKAAYQNAHIKTRNGKGGIKVTGAPLMKPEKVGIPSFLLLSGKWFAVFCQVYWEGESKEAGAALPHQHCLLKRVNSQVLGRGATLIFCNFASSNVATSSHGHFNNSHSSLIHPKSPYSWRECSSFWFFLWSTLLFL